MENNDTLTVTLADGRELVLDVIDILESEQFKKDFVLYTIKDKEDTIYASILNETETSYSLDTITEPAEIAYVNEEIKKINSL